MRPNHDTQTDKQISLCPSSPTTPSNSSRIIPILISTSPLPSKGYRVKGTHSFSASPNGSHEKINAPRNAPMNIQMIIYPLKYIASNMMKYATANCSICSAARMSCSMSVGRIIPLPFSVCGCGWVVMGVAAVFVSWFWFWDCCCWSKADVEFEFDDEGEDFPPAPTPFPAPVVGEGERNFARNLALFTINASYSRPTRRRNSRMSTRQITPIHEPANIPREVMCHDLARKPVAFY